jgi:hypothetical protein
MVTTRPQIADSAFVGSSSDFAVATLVDGDFLTVDIDQIGSTIAGADLVVTIWFAGT